MKLSDLEDFAELLKAKFSLPGSASPEDQLKPPVADLIKQAGQSFALKVESRTETHLAEHKIRPDIAIYVDGLICGYIELKAPGLGADADKLKGKHNKDQWTKLKGLPNLIYTDGREWALYRGGERQGSIARLDDDPTEAGKAAASAGSVEALNKLFRSFLFWIPTVPHKPTELAQYLAPLTRFLRSEVATALETPGSDISALAAEWRSFFFPHADDAQFADAYAQTVTYALLLARLSGATKLDPTEAAKTLDKGNRLLARTLELLGQPAAREELRVGFELLQRSLEALDPHAFLKSKPDLWLYFYEDFLAAYDPRLRKDYGVYYTPREVVELQVRLASELLEKRFGKKLGFADDGVVFLDPAVGTGTYPVAAVKYALEKVKERSGAGAVAGRATQMAENMYGFEILVGPYAVAHLRLTQALEGSGATIPQRLKIYLADTLESPNATPPGGLSLTYKALTQEHEAARNVKKGGEVLVCLGNPPYDRQRIEEGDTATHRKGGWVRFGDQIVGGAKQENQGERPIFEDFLEPARAAGKGVYLQVMYNDYLYFWRWALWRVFEQQTSGGIVTFITASSYLAGPGFVGVREVMRRTFDELWIIDLGGDNLGTRKTPNVFNIQTPVAIAIGMRGDKPSPNTPATVHYARVDGASREAKLAVLSSIDNFDNVSWRTCADEWQAPFLPKGQGAFFDWPLLEDVFPWRYNGTQWFRGWTVAPTRDVLVARLNEITKAPLEQKRVLFKESAHRKVDRRYSSTMPGGGEKPVSELVAGDVASMNLVRFGWRTFDRAWAIVDARFGDRLRKPLWQSMSDRQVFLTCLMAVPHGLGPSMQSTVYLPDCHIVRGSYGGRDIIPLYRDAEALNPNITVGLLEALASDFGFSPSAEDFAAYVYSIMGGLSFSVRFWNELETPGPRVPITRDPALFASGVELGKRLLWLHTYAERYQGPGRAGQIDAGLAKSLTAIASSPKSYPDDFSYDALKRELKVGDGTFGPVDPSVWEYEASGLKVLQSWLTYRMRERGGKKTSPLDNVHPPSWTPRLTDELLELIWLLEATLAMEPALAGNLDKIVAGPCFLAGDLPTPSATERASPADEQEDAGDQLSMFEAAD